jgi:ABC-2 type transport system permease protein
MAIIILFTIITGFEIDIFVKLRPYLFTTHMNNWQSFFDFELNWTKILRSVLIIVGHIVVFISVTLFLFDKKDITS